MSRLRRKVCRGLLAALSLVRFSEQRQFVALCCNGPCLTIDFTRQSNRKLERDCIVKGSSHHDQRVDALKFDRIVTRDFEMIANQWLVRHREEDWPGCVRVARRRRLWIIGADFPASRR